LPILLITQIFAAITSLFTNYLIYFERTGIASVLGLIMSLVSVGLGLWLVPVWGVYGAALSTMVVGFIYLVIYYYLVIYFKKLYMPKVIAL